MAVTPRAHHVVRLGAMMTAVLIPLLLLLPPRQRVEPDRAAIVIPRAVATLDLSSLPLIFGSSEGSPPDQSEEVTQPKLVGVAGRFPADAVALVRLPGGPTHTIEVGETFANWRLSALEPDRATFARGGEHYDSVIEPVE